PNIGSGIALALARYGAKVACNDLDLEASKAAVRRISRNGGEGLALSGDVSVEADVLANIDAALDAWGRIDIVVNNAAWLHTNHILDEDLASFNRAITIAVNGNFLFTKHAALAMIPRGIKGSIVSILSSNAWQGASGFIAYATHKGGLANFVRAAAMDLAPYGIRVNSFTPTAPRPDNPELLARWRAEGRTELRPRLPKPDRPAWWSETGTYDVRGNIPMGEPATPTDIGHCIAWLSSDYARLITGCDFVVDGGDRARICGSDVEQYRGNLSSQWLPMVPGHEPLGIIEEVSEAAAARWGVRPGDRVAVEILIPCRSCDLCLAGRYMSCRHRIGSHGGSNPPERGLGPWGGFAEYIHLHPNAILHKVRGDIPAEIAVMFNPLGAGVRWAAHLGGVGLGDTVLILGAGQRGLAAVLAARTAGAGTIIVTGLSRDVGKLALAREFGADHTIDVEAEDTVARVLDLTGGAGADVVLELTPMALSPILDAVHAVRWGGRVVLAGLKGGRAVELPTDLLINKSLTVMGAFSVDSRAYAEAIRSEEHTSEL